MQTDDEQDALTELRLAISEYVKKVTMARGEVIYQSPRITHFLGIAIEDVAGGIPRYVTLSFGPPIGPLQEEQLLRHEATGLIGMLGQLNFEEFGQ